MRILRYRMRLQLPGLPCTYDIVPLKEIKEDSLFGRDSFKAVCEEVKSLGFEYVVVDQPEEVLIESEWKDVK